MNRDFPLHWYNWFENLPSIDVAKIENIFHSKTTNRWFVSNFGWNCAPIKSWQVWFSHDSQVASEFHSLFAFWSMLDMQPLQWRHIRVHPYCRQRKKQCLILFSLCKICLEMPRKFLGLPIIDFVFCYAHFGQSLSWAVPKCVWASLISFESKMDWAKGR